MRRALTRPLTRTPTKPRLDAARPPLSRLARRDWIWRGEQALDGLFLPVSDGAETAQAAAALAPHLPRAQSVLEGPDGVLLLFGAPVARDCAALGPSLPLRRVHGALTAFPFAPPRSPDVAAAIRDRLLLMRAGAPVALALDRFRAADLAAWIDLDPLAIVSSEAPPALRRPTRKAGALAVKGMALADPQDSDAGLATVRQAVAARKTPPEITLPKGFGTAAAIGAAIIAVVALALMVGGAGGGAAEIWLVGLGLLTALVLGGLFHLFRRRPDDGAAPASNPARVGAGPKRASLVSTLWRWTNGVLSAFVLVVIAGVVLQQVVAAESLGDALAAIFGALLLGVFFWLVGTVIGGVLGLLGIGGGGGESASEAARPPRAPDPAPGRSEPGWLSRWLDRLLQHTPMSDRALGKYARRVRELERLFGEGRIDEALKKALAIDPRPPEQGPVRADLPVRGPGLREQLRIEASRPAPARALAALPQGARETLEALYRAQAQKSRETGDVEHAAFIYAELLGDAEMAVKCFADAGRFETAARLAQGRNLSPALFIPLWARAGAVERALALAEQHGAHEMVLNAIDPEDEDFRDMVRRRWSERLASVGAFADALRVSAPLATRDPAARQARLDWMAEALARPEPDPEVLARAVLATPWPTAPEEGAPRENAPREDGPKKDGPMEAAAALMAAEGETAARARLSLAELLLQPDFEPDRDPAFARRRMPLLADQLPRRLLRDQTVHGEVRSLRLLQALAEAGGQSALATDLRFLPRRHNPRPAPARRSVVIGAIRGAAAVVAAAPLVGARTLVGYEDGRIELLDRRGAILWRERVWTLRDLVPVAPGRMALIIRDEPDGRRLSVLDADMRRHAEIGPVALEAWASSTSEASWLVFDGRAVIDLRTGPLVAALAGGPPEQLEQNWATPITIEGAMLALARPDAAADARWLFRRADGAVEQWSVSASTLRVGYRVVRVDDTAGPLASLDLERFERVDSSGMLQTIHLSWLREGAPAGESTAPPIILRGGRPLSGAAVLAPVRRDPSRIDPAGVERDRSGVAFALVAPPAGRSLELAFEGATDAWFRDGRHCETAALVDGIGRLAIVSTRTGEILHANAEIRDAGG